MNEKQPITEDLLGKFLAQETDAQESSLVENWLKQDKNHQKELDDYQFIWQQVASLKEEKTVDVDLAWNKVKNKLTSPKEAKVVEFTPKKQVSFTPIRIAASITLLLAGMLALFLSKSLSQMQEELNFPEQ